MANNYAYIGEELKFAVTLTASGFSMLSDDFEIVISQKSRQKVFTKDDLIIDENRQYYLLLDTSEFKKGDLYVTVTAWVPDEDFPDSDRKEINHQKLITLYPV